MPVLSKETRIKRELNRLKKFYSELPQNRLAIVMPLLENMAFMKITLDDLQKSINEHGCSDEYKNGENQYGRKAGAVHFLRNEFIGGCMRSCSRFFPNTWIAPSSAFSVIRFLTSRSIAGAIRRL